MTGGVNKRVLSVRVVGYIKQKRLGITALDNHSTADYVAIVQITLLMSFTNTPHPTLLLQLCHKTSPSPPQVFANFAFFILPSDSVLALWIQSSRIHKKPLNALQFWRRGTERDYFLYPTHPFYGFLSLLALILPVSFPPDLHSSKVPLRELMT